VDGACAFRRMTSRLISKIAEFAGIGVICATFPSVAVTDLRAEAFTNMGTRPAVWRWCVLVYGNVGRSLCATRASKHDKRVARYPTRWRAGRSVATTRASISLSIHHKAPSGSVAPPPAAGGGAFEGERPPGWDVFSRAGPQGEVNPSLGVAPRTPTAVRVDCGFHSSGCLSLTPAHRRSRMSREA
jgi:hypothetical protein